MEAKLLDMSQWVKAGEGAQGDSYNHVTDRDYMVKLYNEEVDTSDIVTELQAARNAQYMGFSTPEPGEFVTDGKRFGLKFRRIANKVSFCTAVSRDPSCLNDMAQRMVTIAKQLHSTKADKTRLPDFRDFLRTCMAGCTLDEKEKWQFEKLFETVPDGDTCVHGDFHFGNIITDGQKDYLIDLSAFGYGRPEWDLAMFYFIAHFKVEAAMMYNYHIDCATALEYWNRFAEGYYGTDYNEQAVREHLKPYIFMRTLFFEVVMGHDDNLVAIREEYRPDFNSNSIWI